ncbi:activator of 90 kDa heat shock protein ATPase [Musa troglodytarum]|uniref:Activator of 90 kDa heat shock protein ATPase n=1 Tax=Musa troglodytarum TaxID=320322 RepID=A0A9E7I9N9_9LILI|nr:activator of 90 kDa heat shock protein ATPase [Musa troglodytarum]
MEDTAADKKSSYTYWVREATEDAAPRPVPRKLSADDLSKQPRSAVLGSVWNQAYLAKFRWMSSRLFCTSFAASSLSQWLASVLQAGTWEERNLNSWASNRIKELLKSLGSLEFSSGKAYIEEVTKCSGDAFLVTVRNKKRVGYTYEVTIKFKGDWLIQKENKKIKGHLDIPEFSFGELEDLQIQVRLSEDKDLSTDDKMKICNDLRLCLAPIRKKLEVFEQELRDSVCVEKEPNGGGSSKNREWRIPVATCAAFRRDRKASAATAAAAAAAVTTFGDASGAKSDAAKRNEWLVAMVELRLYLSLPLPPSSLPTWFSSSLLSPCFWLGSFWEQRRGG